MISFSMKTKFLTFFTLIALAGVFSIIGSWVIQYRLNAGDVNFLRAAFQIALLAVALYFLWQKSTPGYILAILYGVGNLVISGLAVLGYLTLWNSGAEFPANSLVINSIVAITALSALIVFLLDYLDYQKRRISVNDDK